jgi:branched-chain amino acid transport system ATP-binding protein
VSFAVSPGECVAMIGPNGAGKSTCFACIAGQYRPTSGSVQWRGASLDGLTPSARLRRGVGRTFQVAQVFEALTVLQNVQLAMLAGRRSRGFFSYISGFRKIDAQAPDEARALLEKTGLQTLAGSDVLRLPYGAKKRLELALALAARPTLLLLDEPAAGLAEQERTDLMKLVKSLARGGMAVLYTEHNMDAVAQIADRVLVLIEGKLAAQGTFEEISVDPEVRRRYLGEFVPSQEVPHA